MTRLRIAVFTALIGLTLAACVGNPPGSDSFGPHFSAGRFGGNLNSPG